MSKVLFERQQGSLNFSLKKNLTRIVLLIMSDQPRRLQSLSSRGRGGRFLPKAVSRRSEKERESTAPAIKPEGADGTPGDMAHGGQSNPNKKFERRPKRQIGTRAEAEGPLAAPAIAAPQRNARMGSRESGERSDMYRGPAGVKSEAAIEEFQAQFIYNDEGRIDMKAMANSSASLCFPLSVPVEETKDNDQPTTKDAEGDAKNAADSDNMDDNSTAEPQIANAAEDPQNHMTEDLEETANVSLDNNKLYLVQLPSIGLKIGLPRPENVPAEEVQIKDEQTDVPMPDVSADSSEPVSTNHVNPSENGSDAVPTFGSCGRLGTLRTHRSGKKTLLIGDLVYELKPGAELSSIEDVIVLNEETKEAHRLGTVQSKILAVPDLSQLEL